MSTPAQSVCATQPAIQNRKKRAGRPRSSRKKRTRRMENEIASKKVIARSPWFGMVNRKSPFWRAPRVQRKSRASVRSQLSQGAARLQGKQSAERRPFTNLARAVLLQQETLGV